MITLPDEPQDPTLPARVDRIWTALAARGVGAASDNFTEVASSSTIWVARPQTGKAPVNGRSVREFSSWPLRRWVAYGVASVGAVVGIAVLGTGRLSLSHTGENSSPTERSYTTAPGQRANLTLVDGTRVILNVGSRLRVSSDFGTINRTVSLDGEAHFVVLHDAKRPFIVHANGTVVRDLATTFVVRTYRDEAKTSVAVRDGKVAVESPTLARSNSVVLQAGQVARITVDGVALAQGADDVQPFFAWTTGQLVLRDVPLGQALIMLSRWYGREFRAVDSTLLHSRIDAKLPAQFDPSAINELAVALGGRVTIGNTVVMFLR